MLFRSADVERIRQSLGLDRPFLIQFGSWLWHILHGDLGTSIFTNLPVSTMIGQRLGPTLSLMCVTLLLTIVVAVPLGVVAAWKAGSFIDRAIMAFAVFGFSLPVFVVGYVLAYVFALELEWLPVQGYTPLTEGFWPWLQNLILPAIALGWGFAAMIARLLRAGLVDVYPQPYVVAARARGLSEPRILATTVLRNASGPMVAALGLQIGQLLAGAVAIEVIFGRTGMGSLLYNAISGKDIPTVQGGVLFLAVVYVALNLIVDVLKAIIDPRTRRVGTS